MSHFVINTRLPSVNDYVDVCRRNKYQAAQFKRDVEEVIEWAIRGALATGTLEATSKPCKVKFEWHEKTMKRDVDNIAGAKKFILDAMQTMGIIVNDNQKYVKGFTDDFIKDDKDFVRVELVEVSE